MRLLGGLVLLEMHRVDEAARTLSGALKAADALLAPADKNVVVPQAGALALSGLAADTDRLLDAIAPHDRIGILAEARADRGW